MNAIDPKELRNAFGQFMTGVTVVTTKDKHGEPVGFTANSFSSVSLDPPLLLVCLANGSSNYDTFCNADGFAVNILAQDQTEVSNTFARPVDDRFAAVQWQDGPLGSPVLDGVCAWFDCSMEQRVKAGDHVILIGRVAAFENHERGGLGYASGGYFSRDQETEAARKIALDVRASVSAVVRHGDSILLHGSDADGWAESDETSQGRFVPLDQLEQMIFSNPVEKTLMRRFASESSMGNFKIYIGNKLDGQIQGD